MARASYKTSGDWFDRIYPTLDATLELNALLWQLFLLLYILSSHDFRLLILVISTIVSIIFLEKTKKKRKPKWLRKAHVAVYGIAYGFWLGLTIILILFLLKIT